MASDLSLTLCESPETEDGVVRIDPADMAVLGAAAGDVIGLEGARRSYVRVLPAFMEDRNQRLARVNGLTAKNLGLQAGQSVRLLSERIKPPHAELIVLEAQDDLDRLHAHARERQLAHFWRRRPVVVEDFLRVPTLDRYPLSVKVVATRPSGVVQLSGSTALTVAVKDEGPLPKFGGAREAYRACWTFAEGRLKRRMDLAAQSVLLSGPAGCGKSLIVSRLAKDLGIALHGFDVRILMDRYLAQGGTDLAVSLSELARRGPTILLFDHLEALESQRELSPAREAAALSIGAQIGALLDEVPTQPDLLVFGVFSGAGEPSLGGRRPFDLHVPVDAPNLWGRQEALLLATEGLPLAADVDLAKLAALTSGATGRDLKQLVKTAYLTAAGPKIEARDFFDALRAFEPSAASEVRCDIPTTLWDDIVGFDELKQLLRDTLSWALQLYDRFAAAGVRPPGSVLLSGGQGTGKTSLVRSLAGFMPVNFIEIDCALLAARGEAAAAAFLKESFALARRKAPCLVFFDEIDALFDGREGEGDAIPRHHPIVAQLMADLDAMSVFPGVVVIAATSRPDRLTAEILRPGRFDFAVSLPLPDAAARKKILQVHARKLPIVSDIDFDKLSASTHGMSPADIANLCNRVGMMALRNSLSGPDGNMTPPAVSFELFEQALRGRKAAT